MINNADKFKKMKREDFESETGVPLDELKQVLDAKRYIEFADKIRDFSLDGKMISKQAEQTFDRIVYPANLARELEDNILPDQIQEIIDSKAKKTVKKSFAEQVEEIRKSMIV